MRKTKDEETVDKAVLQKYHRGKQNRFKVSLENVIAFLMFHRVRTLYKTRVYNFFDHQNLKDKKLRGKLKSYESQYQQAAVQAAKSELLLTEEPG